MISWGSGYSSLPSVVFAQDTGAGAFVEATGYSVLSSGASATPLIGTYLKTFTGAWNFYTGSGSYLHKQAYINDLTSGYDNFREREYYISGSSAEPYGYENNRIFFQSKENNNESDINLIVTITIRSLLIQVVLNMKTRKILKLTSNHKLK